MQTESVRSPSVRPPARSAPRLGLRAVAAAALALTALAAGAQDHRGGPKGGGEPGGRGGPERHAGPPERGAGPFERTPPFAGGPHGRPEFGAPHMRYDNRFHDGHYYPARGFVSASLPPGALTIGWRGGRYHYQGGVWFRPHGSRFTVIAPPFGIVLPLLPLAYATLWFNGAPYYYANNVYYAPVAGGYQVVPPPPGIEAAQGDADDPALRQSAPAATTPPAVARAAAPDPVVYPRNGQTPEQTEADRQQCNSWATSQPGAIADASVFQRAAAACMDGRGYTVR